jgi:hypothetical protein
MSMPLRARCFAGASVVVVWSFISCLAAVCQDRATLPRYRAWSQLAALGDRGITIAVAREKVLQILQAENSCRAWFLQADPDPAGVFAGLRFTLDLNGPRYITASKTDYGEEFLKHPYAASVPENAGRGAVITLNANGPFFNSDAVVLQQDYFGGPLHRIGWRLLRVQDYPGNSLAARITTLLHELGHIVGRLPEDFDEDTGQSGRNTAEVLRFCRGQIKNSARADHLAVINLGD